MAEILTPSEVIALAFGDGEYVAAEAISPLDIDAATERWVRPVVGEGLLQAIGKGKYSELSEGYLKPAIALYTRYIVQPRLNAATSQLGLTVPTGSHRKAADEKAREELMQALLKRARTALKRLSRQLEQQAAEIPEYRSAENILRRCSIDGGFVQKIS